jgi:hypothetical protein
MHETIAVMLIPMSNNKWELVAGETYEEFGTITLYNTRYVGVDIDGVSTMGTLDNVVIELTNGRGLLETYKFPEDNSLFDNYEDNNGL